MYHGSNQHFSGRFWAFFWVFSMYHGFFWVFSGLIGVSWVKLRSMWLRRFSGLFIGIFLGIFDGLGFKLAAWVSDRWLGFADWWLGWWVWWPFLAPTGLCVARCVWPLLIGVCGSIDGLVVCVYVWLC